MFIGSGEILLLKHGYLGIHAIDGFFGASESWIQLAFWHLG